ncbi:MAG: ABC transporter permease, partial [Pirellulales bacterium]|nr:ABC transporter permease [Pirellulales bacterium]
TIVGIAALTVIMAIGKGTEQKVMKRLQNFGPRAIMLIAGRGKDLPPPELTVTTLTLDDADAIRNQIDGLEIVAPMAWDFNVNVTRGANLHQATVWGVEPTWHEAWNWHVTDGEGISDQDVATMAKVCVIGKTVRRELFGQSDPIGERLYINKVALTVKGILKTRGTSPMGMDFDSRMVIPITTAMRRVMNVDHVGAIRLISKDVSLIPRQAEAVRSLIHQRHHITPPEEDDFRLITPMVIARLVKGSASTLSFLLIALAALSLFVGGVVMMNILLISVAERTKEIGLRRAVGATRGDVFAQFLTESLAVTIFGTILGSLLGLGISVLLPRITPMPVVVTWEPFALAVAFALVVGTFFGVQPARRAAKLHPVEALR